jgi:hypothetical protein
MFERVDFNVLPLSTLPQLMELEEGYAQANYSGQLEDE